MIFVIPVSEKNDYSNKGDMESFGETTLAEWKISQARGVADLSQIYITSSSNAVNDYFTAKGMKVILRCKDLSVADYYRNTAIQLDKSQDIFWLNPTSPFIGPKTISLMIETHSQTPALCSYATAVEEYEYFFDKISSDLATCKSRTDVSRREIAPQIRITNGGCISNVQSILRVGSCLTDEVRFHIVPWLASLEVRNSQQLSLYSELIYHYYKAEFQ